MKLTKENYFSLEADQNYMSNSQYKNFLECEARQMAILNGKWEKMATTPCMLIGKYVHAWNEKCLEEFKEENPEIFTLKGELRSDFKNADKVIDAISKDKLFIEALSGQTEVIFTADMFGAPWKILIDSYFPDKKTVRGS